MVMSPLVYAPVTELEEYHSMRSSTACALEVDKSDIRHTRLADLPERELKDGQILISLESFSLTSNNITYGLFGDSLNYWKFFPATSQGWGNIPVWGFASVEESLHDDIEPGERIYGYFPMASSHILTPEDADDFGFLDESGQRSKLPRFYNRYLRVSSDQGYKADFENQQLLFRPLFLTAFLLDDLLARNNSFGAEQIVISSASSKTAMALAWLLRQRNVNVVGLTSQTGRAFAKNSQNFDSVILYGEIEEKLPQKPSVFLDFTGVTATIRSVHTHLGDQLKASYRTGSTHWQDASTTPDLSELSGPSPSFFAATEHGRKLVAEYGADEVQRRMMSKLLEFYEPASRWIKAARGVGTDAIQECYDRVVTGKMLPSEGYILSFGL